MQANWWHPEQFSLKKDKLFARSAIMREIARFFDENGFCAVQTPLLQVCPVIDTHIRAFGTDRLGVDGKFAERLYLHTSPEFAMKKLMVAGMDKIYQICPVFRNAEGSKRHRCEFTLLEWYRMHADYTDMMHDCEALLRYCARALKVEKMRFQAHECDPFQEFERLSVCDAFMQYARIDLITVLDDTVKLREQVSTLGLHTADDDAWDDLFFRVMDDKIEPNLGMGRPTFLCDYPISMASLSKPKANDPRFAERFELYVCGIELANAFSELTDGAEQERRYHVEMNEKERLYGERYPLDEDFIAALKHGMPESGGIALGVDRLIMLMLGADDIKDVMWCE